MVYYVPSYVLLKNHFIGGGGSTKKTCVSESDILGWIDYLGDNKNLVSLERALFEILIIYWITFSFKYQYHYYELHV